MVNGLDAFDAPPQTCHCNLYLPLYISRNSTLLRSDSSPALSDGSLDFVYAYTTTDTSAMIAMTNLIFKFI